MAGAYQAALAMDKPNISASIRRAPPVAGPRRGYGPLSPGRQGSSRL